MASVVGTLAPYLGFVASMKLSEWFIKTEPLQEYPNIFQKDEDVLRISEEIDFYLLTIAIIETILTLVVIVGFREITSGKKNLYHFK